MGVSALEAAESRREFLRVTELAQYLGATHAGVSSRAHDRDDGCITGPEEIDTDGGL